MAKSKKDPFAWLEDDDKGNAQVVGGKGEKCPRCGAKMSGSQCKKCGYRMSEEGDGNWIAGAIAKPGALRKELGAKPGRDIPTGKLAKAAKKGGAMGKRARLAETLKSFNP